MTGRVTLRPLGRREEPQAPAPRPGGAGSPPSWPGDPGQHGAPGSGPPTSGPGATRIRIAIALAVLLVVGGLVALTTLGGTTPAPAPVALPTVAGSSALLPSAPVAAPASAPVDAPPVAPLAASAPLRVRVASIGAASTLTPVGLDAQNRMEVPPLSQPMQAAWYTRSPAPGAVGPSVVVGHVNGSGRPGIFARLSEVRPGQRIEIDRADGRTAEFTVHRVDTVAKDAFPTREVYGDTPDAQLRLVTCGGELDRAAHNYLSNVVVFATLTGVRPT